MAISFVDVAKRPPAPGELRRFSQRHGARALLDEEGKAYRDAGLGYLRMTDDEILARLLADPRLLRLPLVRNGLGGHRGAGRGDLARLAATPLTSSTAAGSTSRGPPRNRDRVACCRTRPGAPGCASRWGRG